MPGGVTAKAYGSVHKPTGVQRGHYWTPTSAGLALKPGETFDIDALVFALKPYPFPAAKTDPGSHINIRPNLEVREKAAQKGLPLTSIRSRCASARLLV